jgi:hypothetical protein
MKNERNSKRRTTDYKTNTQTANELKYYQFWTNYWNTRKTGYSFFFSFFFLWSHPVVLFNTIFLFSSVNTTTNLHTQIYYLKRHVSAIMSHSPT